MCNRCHFPWKAAICSDLYGLWVSKITCGSRMKWSGPNLIIFVDFRHKSITVDPFWDISLDIIGDHADSKAAIGLDECLMRYTRVEHLGSGGMIRCKDCDRNQESTKQLKFKVLPVILCLHLKASVLFLDNVSLH